MPVHETKGGYKYGETGKTYKDKKSAIKQAIAIAYSKAEKKGRKPSQEEIKNEIGGNPDKVEKTASVKLPTNPCIQCIHQPKGTHKMMSKSATDLLITAGRLRKQAAALEKQAGAAEWLAQAKDYLTDPEVLQVLKQLGVGGAVAGGTYAASGLFDKGGKNRLARALAALGIGTGAALATPFAERKIKNALTERELARQEKEYLKDDPSYQRAAFNKAVDAANMNPAVANMLKQDFGR